MNNDKTYTDTKDGYRALTLKQLRDAAAHLVDPEALGIDVEVEGFPPLSKRALGSLIEAAFPEPPPRGLAYAEEVAELGAWVRRIALTELHSPTECRWEMLLAAAVAEAAASGDAFTSQRRELVRAVATYFVRTKAVVVASHLKDIEQEKDVVVEQRMVGT